MREDREEREDRNERKELVEATLAALGRAEAPAGLEARVLRGVQRKVAETPAAAVREVWWRGALTGGAFALLFVGAGLFVQHEVRMRTDLVRVVQVQGHRTVAAENVGVAIGRPCAGSGAVAGVVFARVHREAPGRGRSGVLRVETAGRIAPAPELVLTAEERELVRLAHEADPKQVATLIPEVRAKAEAEDVAQFESFFYQPPVKVDGQKMDGQIENQ